MEFYNCLITVFDNFSSEIYDVLYERKTIEATRLFMEIWDDIKKFVTDNFYMQVSIGKIL